MEMGVGFPAFIPEAVAPEELIGFFRLKRRIANPHK